MHTSTLSSHDATPVISVCLSTYNQKQYIVDCMESVVSQETEFPFEVLVGDDASTDGTSDIVADYARRYPEMVVHHRYSSNVGPYRNFVETHNRARSRFVAHIDGDDLMLPGKLQAQAKFLTENPDYTVVWHPMDVFNDQGKVYPGDRQDLSTFDNGVVRLDQAVRIGCIGIHSACMYRRSARKTRDTDHPRLDTYMAWEFLSSGPGKMLTRTFGKYRANSSTSMRRKFDTRRVSADNAQEFLSKHPGQKGNIAVFAFCNLLIDLKNRRPTVRDWLRVLRACKTIPNPVSTVWALLAGRKFMIPRLD